MNDREAWTQRAEEVVAETLSSLPAPLRERARALAFSYEWVPGPAWIEEGVEADSLGLFTGSTWEEQRAGAENLPPLVTLFIENLVEFSEGRFDVFDEEVRITFLHELGHYLGLDEEELADRGLE